VVIAIIGVLIALLLPAVQAAREAAARMNCQSHMKNVALAFHNYHDTHQAFPLGADRDTMGTWAMYVLPFIEQGALYSSYNFQRAYNNNTVDPGFSKGNQDLLYYLRIPVYSCPTDGDRKSSYGNYMHHNLVVCMGNAATYRPNDPGTNQNSVTGRGWAVYGDITAIQGAMFWGGCRIGEGTTWSLGYKWVSLAEVTDGLSNTIALSETVQGERSPSAQGAGTIDLRGLIWWGEGGQFTTYRSPNTRTADNVQFTNTTYPGGGTMHNPRHPIAPTLANDVTIATARSFHSGGVNAALGDGSVRFFSDTVNIDAWRAFATTQGGETLVP
jgi:prepilin-type processing-associated H-X9-DG protein